LGIGSDPEVELLFDSDKRCFRNGAWDTASDPQIHIFDAGYIHDNVFVGDFVEHENKKNLYRVIVGEQGVALAAAIDQLDDEHRDATKDAGAKLDGIKAKLPSGLTVESYVAFTEDPLILTKITEKEKEITALQQAEAIGKRSLLSLVELPPIPKDVDSVLTTTIDGVSADAERLVREHVSLMHAREPWLSEGLRLVREDRCPFCSQDVSTTNIIPAYRAFFSESYGALKEKVAALSRDTGAALGAAAAQRFRASVARNDELGQEWTPLTGQAWNQSLDLEAVDKAREALLMALRSKEASPLEAVDPVGHTAALTEYAELRGRAVEYNAAVTSFNAESQRVKDRAKGGNLAQAREDLALLEARRDRFQAMEAERCGAYMAAITLRDELAEQKIEAKKKLDQHASSILAAHQEAINRFLQKFGATFRIKQLERRYAGGSPSSSYVIEINNAQVELGDRKTSRAERSFRNTLSGGDRSALALAFFLAQLERDGDLEKRIVVFDDPFTSQDRGRRLATQQEIRRIRSRAAQVVVLSHDDAFLAECCSELLAVGELRTLSLRRGLTGPVLDEWDVDAPRGQALQDRQRLKEFLADGAGTDVVALRGVARMIRPLIEAYLRGRFLGRFGDSEWLGDMIKVLRENQDKLPEGSALPDELSEVNEFSRRYHHAQNPGADTEPIDETELRTYVERTLTVADGF
jgi:wobble nucleotide-excising tRNase